MPQILRDFTTLLKYRNFLELCLAVLVSMIGFGLIVPLLPIYAREMGASGIYLGLLTSLFGITRCVTSVLGGYLADRVGRKKLIVAGLFIYTVVMFLFGLSTNLLQLFILRACQGAASGVVWPVAATMVADIVPFKARGKAMGVFSMMWDAGIAIGPVLGGLLSAAFTIALPFFVCSALAFVSALLVVTRVEETHTTSEESGEESIEGLSIHRMSLVGMCITGFIASFAMGLVQPILSLFGYEVIKLNEAAIGVIFGAMGITRFIVKPPSGALADTVGRKKVVIAGLFLNGIFTVSMSLARSFLTLVLPSMARAIGLGMTLPSMNALVTSLTTAEKRGRVMGIFSASRNMGLVAGPLLGGVAFDAISPQAPFLLCGIVVFIGATMLAVMVKEPEENEFTNRK
jgi:DHA1 family multidrug resistance protein-like MFS transporter